MKKIGILLFVFTLVLTSCSKDDDAQDPLIGSWEYTENIADFGDFYLLLTFKSDGTGVEIYTIKEVDYAEEIYTETFTWTKAGNFLIMEFNEYDEDNRTWTYEISGNKLTLGDSADSVDTIVLTRK